MSMTNKIAAFAFANPKYNARELTEKFNVSAPTVYKALSIARKQRELAATHTVKQAVKPTANDRQEGGTHYKQFKHETWDVILDWGLGYLDGNAVKYLSRWKHKGGVDDLKKARHYIDKLIELSEASDGVQRTM